MNIAQKGYEFVAEVAPREGDVLIPVDAFAYNFRVLVAQDAVYDRSQVSHAVNLFDMSEKYADVAPTAEVLRTLQSIPSQSVSPSVAQAG